VRRLLPAVLALTATIGLSGCGWLGASGVSHTKPSGFLLRGYASVGGAQPGQAGAPCDAPTAKVGAKDPVRVTDAAGRELATGTLGAGVLASGGAAYRCNFPFEIAAVPGGQATYSISVGGRPPVTFPATELRQDKSAVVSIDPS
jgi:hypothetical protein